MKTYLQALLLGAVLFMSGAPGAMGHGRLWEPPGRSTMWRRNFTTPINYDDNQLNCGGFAHQVSLNGKCGLCGDPYDGPRLNEEGGLYATGVISRTYQQGQIVTIQVDITANHLGYFEFHLCQKASSGVKTTQLCLDKYPLSLADGSGTRYKVPSNESKMYYVSVRLPAGLACNYCVLQWRYHTGNSWGQNPDGTQCMGCGFQEEFYGCADIRILKAVAAGNSPGSTTQTPPIGVPVRTCRATKLYAPVSGMDQWCADNCQVQETCPPAMCECC